MGEGIVFPTMQFRRMHTLLVLVCLHLCFAADLIDDLWSETCDEAGGRESRRGLIQKSPQSLRGDVSTELAADGHDDNITALKEEVKLAEATVAAKTAEEEQ